VKVSPHLKSTRLLLPNCESAVPTLDCLSTTAPAGQPPLPATGVPEEETHAVLAPAKPFEPAGS